MSKTFYVVDLSASGEKQLAAEYQYEQLERIPGAAELIVVFATHLYRDPQEFEIPMPHGCSHIKFRWLATSATGGIGTLRAKSELASLSLLASGKDPAGDRATFEAFQLHMLRQLHDTGYEPSFDLMNIKERPLVATINFVSPEDEAGQLVVALADRCFAAAYFRYQGLA